MAILQVKGLNDDLYAALQARASMHHRSLSQEVTLMIKEALSQTDRANEEATEDFLALAGSWEDNRSAKEIVSEIRRSRKNRKLRGGSSVLD